MSKHLSRRKLLAGAAIPVAAVPLAKLVSAGETDAGASTSTHIDHQHQRVGHASMFGAGVPAPGGPNALDALLIPPPALPHQAIRPPPLLRPLVLLLGSIAVTRRPWVARASA